MNSFRKLFKMGANLGTFKRSSSARSSTCMSSSTGASLMELLKPGCLRSDNNVRKRPFSPDKKKIVYSTKTDNVSAESSFTSLGEWLTSSPGSKPDSMNGGELYVLRPHHSSRRVHPSSASSSSSSSYSQKPRTHDDEASSSSKARDNIINQDAKLDNINPKPSLSRNQSGNKSKKKVSFRLPEEADIVLFYPSEEMFIDCEENFV